MADEIENIYDGETVKLDSFGDGEYALSIDNVVVYIDAEDFEQLKDAFEKIGDKEQSENDG